MTQKNDLGLKMGTKRQVIFEDLKKATEAMISDGEKALIANKAILVKCCEEIEAEKRKL